MAGEFFLAVDRELTSGEAGQAAAAEPLATAVAAGAAPAAAGPAAPKLGEVFRRPAAPAREGPPTWQVALAGAAVGAAIALIGVALGARSARRT
jgi:uncharacterized protein